MPLYEYRCESCGRAFEQLRRLSDNDRDVRCPDCDSKEIKRLLSSFATGGCGTGARGRFT